MTARNRAGGNVSLPRTYRLRQQLNLADIVHLDATVDLQTNIAAAGIDQLTPGATYPASRDEALTTKPGLTDISRITSSLSIT